MTDKLYPLYRESFRAIDVNHDGFILPEEYDQVQGFDLDHDKRVTLWEYLATHNNRQASQGLAPLFSNQLIDRLKESYQVVFREKNEVIFPSLPNEAELSDLIDTVTKLQEMEVRKDEISAFLEKTSEIRPSPSYQYLPPLLESLQPLSVTPWKVIEFLTLLVERIGYGPNIDEAHQALLRIVEFLKEKKLTGDEILDFLTAIVKEGGLTEVGTTFEMIPGVAQIFCDQGMPIREVLSAIKTLTQKAKWNEADLFVILPKTVTELKSLGKWDNNGPKRIEQIVSTAGLAAADAVSLYPTLLEIGFTDNEFDRLIEKAISFGGDESWKSLKGMKRAIESLKKRGYKKTEVEDFLHKSLSKYGLAASEIYDRLEICLEAGLTPTDLLSFPYEVARNLELPPRNGPPRPIEPETVLSIVCEKLPYALQDLKAAGFSTDEIKDLIRDVTRQAGRIDRGSYNLLEEIASTATLLKEHQIPIPEIIEFLKGIARRSGETTMVAYVVLSDFIALHDKQANHQGLKEEFSEFRRGFYLMTEHIEGIDLLGLKDSIFMGNMEFNPARIKDRQTLADQISTIINKRIDRFPLNNLPEDISTEPRAMEIQFMAVLINHLHDRDQKDDLIRKRIVWNLSTKAVYLLSSIAGPDLYTSTFVDRIYAMTILFNSDYFFSGVKKIDPQGKFMAGFILTLAGFNKLKEVFQRDPEYFAQEIVALLQKADSDISARNISLLAKVVGQFIRGEGGSAVKSRIEKTLFEEYEIRKADPGGHGHAAIGYLIKLYHKDFSEKGRAEAIANELPDILPPKVPSEWLANGRLKAVLKFYPDEKHFLLIQGMYARKGFQVRRSASGKTVAMTKSFTRPDGRRITFEVVATLEELEIDKLMSDASVDIISHRGHSYHLTETLPYSGAVRNKRKLIFIGSCGGFRMVPDLMQSYSGNYFISDEDTGRGFDNNNILYHLMEAIAGGLRNWDDIRNHVAKRYPVESRGLVFPNDQSLLLFDFIEAVKTRPSSP